ncbi:MAG: gluconate 2-dehydrogenase subunit 3 family protein [Polyangiaceae bacterium]
MSPLSARALSRRAALQHLATLAAASIAAACAAPPPAAPPPPLRAARFSPRLFTLEQALAVEELNALIIPETDTPGALGANVPSFIESIVADVYEDDERQAFLAGLDALNESARAAHAAPFAACTALQRGVLLERLIADAQRQLAAEAQGPETERPEPFFVTLHALTIEGFCRSKPGATRVLQYVAVPGDYEGSVPLEQVGRAWATS